MNMEALYKVLTDGHFMWDRKDSNTIWVALSGYKCFDAHYDAIMTAAKAAKAINIGADFDQHSGKTFYFFKHK